MRYCTCRKTETSGSGETMLALIFRLGQAYYAVACKKIREVIPAVPLKPLPHAPDFLAGIFSYRGELVPVLDLCRLVTELPCRERLSTRIIITDHVDESGITHPLGLLAEQVTDTLRISGEGPVVPAVRMASAPYLGATIMADGRMVRHIETEKLPDCLCFLSLNTDREDGCSPHDH